MKKFSIAAVLIVLMGCWSLSAQKLHYIDASELTVIGKISPTQNLYHRLDTIYSNLSTAANHLLCYSAGLGVTFQTNSRSISILWESKSQCIGNNSSLIAQKGFDLYIKRDGKWIYAASGCNNPDKLQHSCTLVDGMNDSMKECLLYLPLGDEIAWLKIGIEEQTAIYPLPNPFKCKVVMLGSSIVHGFSASRPGMTLPARMSRATGIDFINLGISGECKLQLALADVIANTQADAFLLDCFSNPSSDEIEKYFDDFVARIRINHPQIPLIFVQTLIRESGNFNLKLHSFERRKRWMAEQKMGQLMKSDPYVYFINPGMDIGCDHEGTIDGIHPTDLGFTRIIEGIQTEIIEILENATND